MEGTVVPPTATSEQAPTTGAASTLLTDPGAADRSYPGKARIGPARPLSTGPSGRGSRSPGRRRARTRGSVATGDPACTTGGHQRSTTDGIPKSAPTTSGGDENRGGRPIDGNRGRSPSTAALIPTATRSARATRYSTSAQSTGGNSAGSSDGHGIGFTR